MPTERMTAEEYRALFRAPEHPSTGGRVSEPATTSPPRPHKYRANRVELLGLTFDSQLEADRYLFLESHQRARKIQGLIHQPEFILQEAFTDNTGTRHRAISCRMDFQYVHDNTIIVEDTKGYDTPVSKLKRKMFLHKYPNITFLLVKTAGDNSFMRAAQ